MRRKRPRACAPERLLVVALTGTPGVGKSAVADELERRGHTVLRVSGLVRRHHLGEGRDRRRGSVEVDTRRLAAAVRRELSSSLKPAGSGRRSRGPVIIEGHLSHLVSGISRAIVLRAAPRLVAKRLRQRGWPQAKVRENVEAEGLGVISGECRAFKDAFEVDATEMTRTEAAAVVERLALAREPPKRYALGSVDWSEDESWY